MKLSAILVSVNIAATIPIAASGAAQAAEGVSDSAEFLKSSLASIDKQPVANRKVARIGNKKMSLSAPADKGPNCISSNGIRLQPFVPNRKLPRQRDLDLQLVAQTPTMAAVPQTTLSAQVSESSAYAAPQAQASTMSNVATYGSTGYIRETSQRMVPAQVVATPGQIRSTRRARTQPIRTIAQEEAAQARKVVAKRPSQAEIEQWLDQPGPGERVINQSGALLVQAPVIAPDEQAVIDKMVDAAQNRPIDVPAQSGTQGVESAPTDSAGPPPFPLNMLPQDSLKQLIGGRKHRRVDAPPSYFGSWHASQTPANLPAAYFHSNLRPRTLSSANYGHYAPRNAVTQIRTINPTPPNTVVAMKPKPQPKVAAYAPYYTQRSMTY